MCGIALARPRARALPTKAASRGRRTGRRSSSAESERWRDKEARSERTKHAADWAREKRSDKAPLSTTPPALSKTGGLALAVRPASWVAGNETAVNKYLRGRIGDVSRT
jgi:hypothetical protein